MANKKEIIYFKKIKIWFFEFKIKIEKDIILK